MKNFKIICFCLFAFWQTLVQGQTPLMEIENGGIGSLTPSQLDRYNVIKDVLPDGDVVVSEQLIRMNPLSEANINGYFSIDIGAVGCAEINFIIDHIEYNEDSDFFLWSETDKEEDPTVESDRCTGATFFLMADEGAYFGQISYDSIFFKIFHIENNLCLLVGFTPNVQDFCEVLPGGADLNTGSTSQNNTSTLASNTSENCVIDVLFAYTTIAKDYAEYALGLSSIVPYIDSKVSYFNYVAKRSSHDGNYAQIRRSDLLHIPDFEGSDYDKHGAFLHAFKDTHLFNTSYDYDIAHLVCATVPSEENAFTYGVALGPPIGNGDPSAKSSNVSYTVISPYGNETTVVHELAHNLGADHDDEPSYEYNRAKNFKYKTWFLGKKKSGSTIVSRKDIGIIDNFSNPNITFFGEPTGSYDRNNQNYINANKCTVANYGETSLNLYDYITIGGRSNVCPDESATLTAITGQGGTWSFKWYTSSDGINWTLVGQGNSITVTANSSLSSRIIRTKLIAVGGTIIPIQVTYTIYHDVFVAMPGQQGILCYNKMDPASLNNTPTGWDVSLYPNPSGGRYVNLAFDQMPLSDFTIEVIDETGKVISTERKKLTATKALLLDWNNIPSGSYFVKVYYNNEVKTLKIVRYAE